MIIIEYYLYILHVFLHTWQRSRFVSISIATMVSNTLQLDICCNSYSSSRQLEFLFFIYLLCVGVGWWWGMYM